MKKPITIVDFLAARGIESNDLAKAITTPPINRHAIHARKKAGWTIEIKKGVGVVMWSPTGSTAAFHEWDESCLKK